MANFEITHYEGAPVDNTKISFRNLFLRRFSSGSERNELVLIEGYGSTDHGLTAADNWAIYDGVGTNAELVARAQGLRTNIVGNWYNSFVMVFEIGRFKGSTLEIMGATVEKEGEWAIVGGTGDFAMARGIVQRKVHEEIADRDVLELTIHAFCDTNKYDLPKAFRIHCQLSNDYNVAVINGEVIVTKANPSDDRQVWWKHLMDKKDEAGKPGFVLVNKGTGDALMHSLEPHGPVRTIKFNMGHLEDSLLHWAERPHLDGGFCHIYRMNNNDYLFNLYGGYAEEGKSLILYPSNDQINNNELWQFVPAE